MERANVTRRAAAAFSSWNEHLRQAMTKTSNFKKAVLTALVLTLSAPAVFAQNYDSRGPRSNENRFSPAALDRGDALPREFMTDRFVFDEWQDMGFRTPPRGYHWRQVGPRYFLVRDRTRVISDIEEVRPRHTRDDRRDRRDNDRSDRRDDRSREDRWRARYNHVYTYNDDRAYTECRNQADPAGVLAGAFIGALLGNAAGGRNNQTGATVAGVIAGGAIGAALTAKLDCSDRSYAYQTYDRGFNAGRANEVYEWRNPTNRHSGRFHVLDYYQDEDNFRCAVFSSEVTINGRPEAARGRACQQPDGKWAMID